jgi:hypothetical protein
MMSRSIQIRTRAHACRSGHRRRAGVVGATGRHHDSRVPDDHQFDQLVIVSGELVPAKANESVTVQGKACDVPGAFFRNLWSASTNEGGGWEARLSINSKTVLRAVSGSDVSRDVTVQVRAPVYLAPLHGQPSGRFRIVAGGVVPLGGKRVTIERFDRAMWRAVRTVVLDGTGGKKGFRIEVPKGHDSARRAAAFTSQALLPRGVQQAGAHVVRNPWGKTRWN